MRNRKTHLKDSKNSAVQHLAKNKLYLFDNQEEMVNLSNQGMQLFNDTTRSGTKSGNRITIGNKNFRESDEFKELSTDATLEQKKTQLKKFIIHTFNIPESKHQECDALFACYNQEFLSTGKNIILSPAAAYYAKKNKDEIPLLNCNYLQNISYQQGKFNIEVAYSNMSISAPPNTDEVKIPGEIKIQFTLDPKDKKGFKIENITADNAFARDFIFEKEINLSVYYNSDEKVKMLLDALDISKKELFVSTENNNFDKLNLFMQTSLTKIDKNKSAMDGMQLLVAPEKTLAEFGVHASVREEIIKLRTEILSEKNLVFYKSLDALQQILMDERKSDVEKLHLFSQLYEKITSNRLLSANLTIVKEASELLESPMRAIARKSMLDIFKKDIPQESPGKSNKR